MITYKQMNSIAEKIMSIPGMKREHDSDFMAEPADEEAGTTYIKFMSDRGITDDHNGILLSAYLRLNNCVVDQVRLRAMIVSDADLVRLFL